jgi:hypothetical protein
MMSDRGSGWSDGQAISRRNINTATDIDMGMSINGGAVIDVD